MPTLASSPCCPARGGTGRAAPADEAALPPTGEDRAAILVLRFVAAARATGDALCWDAALDAAQAGFGESRGPLVVGRAGALVRRLEAADCGVVFFPPPCRRLSPDEARLLATLREDRPDTPAAAGAAPDELARFVRCLAGEDAPPTLRAA